MTKGRERYSFGNGRRHSSMVLFNKFESKSDEVTNFNFSSKLWNESTFFVALQFELNLETLRLLKLYTRVVLKEFPTILLYSIRAAFMHFLDKGCLVIWRVPNDNPSLQLVINIPMRKDEVFIIKNDYCSMEGIKSWCTANLILYMMSYWKFWIMLLHEGSNLIEDHLKCICTDFLNWLLLIPGQFLIWVVENKKD